MAPSAGSFHHLVVKNVKLARLVLEKYARVVETNLPSSRSAPTRLQPAYARTGSGPRNAAERIAFLKQNAARGGARPTASSSQGSFGSRGFGTARSSHAPRVDRTQFSKTQVGSIMNRSTGRAPFAWTMKPNLTGGALGRTAGGYTLGAGRLGGVRYFSHGPSSPAQVVQNVSQGLRAFFLGGQRAQFSGMDPRTGEKTFRAVSDVEDEVSQRMKSSNTFQTAPGSFIDFSVSPTITALVAAKAAKAAAAAPAAVAAPVAVAPVAAPATAAPVTATPVTASTATTPTRTQSPIIAAAASAAAATRKPPMDTLRTRGLIETLSVDFSRSLKDLAAVLNDLKRLSELGDLPISYRAPSTLRVHFPGTDAHTVEKLCIELGVQRGIVGQDADFDAFAGTEMALLFPFAPSKCPSVCSATYDPMTMKRPHGYTPYDAGHIPRTLSTISMISGTDFEDNFEFVSQLGDWPPSLSGYETVSPGDASTLAAPCPLEYQVFDGVYQFLEECRA